jgi:hypothetical protein
MPEALTAADALRAALALGTVGSSSGQNASAIELYHGQHVQAATLGAGLNVTFAFNASFLLALAVVEIELVNASVGLGGSVSNDSLAGQRSYLPNETASLHVRNVQGVVPLDISAAAGYPDAAINVTAAVRFSGPCLAAAPVWPVHFTLLIVYPPAPVVSQTTKATTQAAIATSVAASVVAGPAGAVDLQSMVLVTLARCSASGSISPGAAASGGYLLVTPFALSDSARGAVAGNAAVFGAVGVLMLLFVGFNRRVRGLSLRQACMESRFPGLLLVLSATLHQSTLFCAIRLAGSDAAGPMDVVMGVCAVLVCLALPAAALAAAARVPRRFVEYECPAESKFARPPLRYLTPTGFTMPRETRLMLSSVITAYTTPSLLCVGIPFFSSFVSNLIAILPASSPGWVCAGSMYLSAAAHVAVATAIGALRVYRFPVSTVLAVVGLTLTASFHAQIASGMRGAIDATMTAQAAVSIVRSVAAAAIGMLEQRTAQEECSVYTTVLWFVGSGGADLTPPADDTELLQLSVASVSAVGKVSGENDKSAVVMPGQLHGDGALRISVGYSDDPMSLSTLQSSYSDDPVSCAGVHSSFLSSSKQPPADSGVYRDLFGPADCELLPLMMDLPSSRKSHRFVRPAPKTGRKSSCRQRGLTVVSRKGPAVHVENPLIEALFAPFGAATASATRQLSALDVGDGDSSSDMSSSSTDSRAAAPLPLVGDETVSAADETSDDEPLSFPVDDEEPDEIEEDDIL